MKNVNRGKRKAEEERKGQKKKYEKKVREEIFLELDSLV